jgi:hypothetical protein
MDRRASEVRGSVILGHRLEVSPSSDGSWDVAVDGHTMPMRSASPYAAWAVGAAESYRQGRVAVSPLMLD